MSVASDLLNAATSEGVTLVFDPPDSLKLRGEQAVLERWTPRLRPHKTELLALLTQANDSPPIYQDGLARARAKVLSDLHTHPGITYAAEVDASGDPVQIMLGIRDIGTCVLEIDAKRWDLEQFIALLDRQAGLGLEVAA